VAGEHGIRRNDAQFLLAGEGLLAVGIPAAIELAFVAISPFLRHMVGRMHGAGAEVEEEGFVGGHLLGIGDHRPGLCHQIGGEVIALLRCGGRFHLAVVLHQFGVVLMGVAAEEAVEALEAPSQGPAVVGAGGGGLLGWGEVPLADGVGVVAVLQQDLGEEAVLERDDAVGAGEAHRSLGDAGQAVGVVVAAVEHAAA